eukprot:COSAG02_NODE_6546_length_3503_cov_2.314336_4_plen_91_part_00
MHGGQSRASDGPTDRHRFTARLTKPVCARTSCRAPAGQRWQICASLLSSASASTVSGQRPTALLTSGSLTCTCAMAAPRTSSGSMLRHFS